MGVRGERYRTPTLRPRKEMKMVTTINTERSLKVSFRSTKGRLKWAQMKRVSSPLIGLPNAA